jgi:hypothetical protein
VYCFNLGSVLAGIIMLVFLNNDFSQTGRVFFFGWKFGCVPGRFSSPKMVEMVERRAV